MLNSDLKSEVLCDWVGSYNAGESQNQIKTENRQF